MCKEIKDELDEINKKVGVNKTMFPYGQFRIIEDVAKTGNTNAALAMLAYLNLPDVNRKSK